MSLGRRFVWTYFSVSTLLIAKVGVWGRMSQYQVEGKKKLLFLGELKEPKQRER